MRRSIAFALIACALLIAGCKDDDLTPPEYGRTLVHVMSAVPQDTFDLVFDYYNADDVVIDDFVFNRNFPLIGYADMQEGGQPDEFGNGKLFLTASRQPFINVAPDTVMPSKDIVLEKDKRLTICLADSAGAIRFLKIEDDFSFATDTSTAVRFINFSNLHATASLGSADGSVSLPNVAFWTSSSYINLPHGQYDVELRDGSGAVVNTVSLWLSGRTAYSFFAVNNGLAYFVN